MIEKQASTFSITYRLAFFQSLFSSKKLTLDFFQHSICFGLGFGKPGSVICFNAFSSGGKNQLYNLVGNFASQAAVLILVGCTEGIQLIVVHNAVHEVPQKKKTVWLKWGAMAACLCFVVAVAVTLFPQNEVISPTDVTPSISGNVSTPSDDENDVLDVIYVHDISQDFTGEFAADMYRPEGFSDNIGSVLAIKISMAEDVDCRFPFIVDLPDEVTLKQLVDSANEKNEQVNAINTMNALFCPKCKQAV